MPRLRFTAVSAPTAAVMPVDLTHPDSDVWESADATRQWLESQRLIRRLRPLGELASMNPADRLEHARALWIAQNA